MTSNFEVSSTTSSPSPSTSYISPHGCVSASVKPMKTISCDLLFCRISEVSTVIITQYCRQAQRPLSGYGNITSASPGRCCSTIGTFCQYWRLYKLVIFGNGDWQCRYGKNGHFIKKKLWTVSIIPNQPCRCKPWASGLWPSARSRRPAGAS